MLAGPDIQKTIAYLEGTSETVGLITEPLAQEGDPPCKILTFVAGMIKPTVSPF